MTRYSSPPYDVETMLSPYEPRRFLSHFTSGEYRIGGRRWMCGDCGAEYHDAPSLHDHHRYYSQNCEERVVVVLFDAEGRMRGREHRSSTLSTDAETAILKRMVSVPATGVER